MALQAPAKDDGYYLVPASPIADLDEASLAEAAALLRLKVPELNRILGADQPVQLSRVARPAEAALIGEGLRRFGMETVTIAEGDLHLEKAAKKIRALELSGDSRTALPTSRIHRVTARCH